MAEGSKNVVVCCDGTGNEFGDSNSNVIDEQQVLYYYPGVGTMGSPNAITWQMSKGLCVGLRRTRRSFHRSLLTYEMVRRSFSRSWGGPFCTDSATKAEKEFANAEASKGLWCCGGLRVG
jgi:hypothetical protein